MTKRTTVTAALPYANGPLHIGHLAGAYLPADIYVRYLKARGRDVHFVCGSDEHGAAIMLRARKEGVSPQELIDKYYSILKNSFEGMKIEFDVYSRTSKPLHHQTALEFFQDFYQKSKNEGANYISEQTTNQLFDPEAQQFLPDRYVTGECPRCHNPNAYGDQCEKCGSTLAPADLINPKSTLSGATPELRPTTHWFLNLDVLEPKIKEFLFGKDYLHNDALEENQRFEAKWKTNVLGQCKSWLNDGLQPRAITRDLDWGVKLPADIPGAEGKVLYVWFDAPIGYISASKDYFAQQGDPDGWKKWWLKQDDPHDNARLIHFIGKDNIVFHCIIFPAILAGKGDYILPDNVPANEFLNLEGEKFSTSRNWAIWVHDYLADPDLGRRVDELRYVLTSIMPETKDADFSWKDYQTRVNSELVNILGNFVNRVLTLIQKYYGGVVPEKGANTVQDNTLLTEAIANCAIVSDKLENYKFRDALLYAMDIARNGNKYLQDEEPWKKIKTEPERVKTILFNALQIVKILENVLHPFLPNSSEKLFYLTGSVKTNWDAIQNGYTDLVLIPAGTKLPEPELLYSYVEDSVIENQLKKLDEIRAAQTAAKADEKPNVKPQKETIQFDDFEKIDLRIATVLEAERVPKTDKLLKLTIDTGIDRRTIVSGIAQYYEPEALIGQKVLVLVNLAPRKLKGIESQGMIMMAEDADGRLTLMQPTGNPHAGAIVK